MIFSPAEMRALEQRAFDDGVSAEALMEDAGSQIAGAVRQFFPVPGKCAVFFGKGHNGGDALVAARELGRGGWEIELRAAFADAAWSALTAQKYRELREANPDFVSAPGTHLHDSYYILASSEAPPLIVLDGLLGIGAGGALREPIAGAAREINRLRAEQNAHVFAIDLPTGLDADSGDADPNCVRADFTLAIGFAKRGLVADSATPFTGRLAVLALRELTARAENARPRESVATARELAPLLPCRNFDVHKGDCGRIAIVAGSRGFLGAAVMAAEACVRAGAGLVSLFVTEEIYPIVAAAVCPEVMVRPVDSYREVLEANRDVIALGPGLGKSRSDEVLELIASAEQPMIIDADGLNILSENLDVLGRCAGPRLLTPHPGEMSRLDPDFKKRMRREAVETFTACWPHALLLKGARTVIGQRERPLSYNSTGSPGMATGGMGDVLTGVCAALAGQRLSLYDAARVGSWVCGRAAELAIFVGGESEESLSPTALLAHLGAAFKELRAGRA